MILITPCFNKNLICKKVISRLLSHSHRNWYKWYTYIRTNCDLNLRSVDIHIDKVIEIIETQGSISVPIFNPFPNKPRFLRICSKSLLKTPWEKEKLLVTSNFSFSHSGFNPFGELSPIFMKLKIVVCELFQFGRFSKSIGII